MHYLTYPFHAYLKMLNLPHFFSQKECKDELVEIK